MDAKLQDEPGRIAALRRYEVLDTPREAPFERITNLVRTVLNVPIATISLIDSDRQWFKSCVGMAGEEEPRATSFCNHTIRSREPMLVADAHLDSRFAHFASVTGAPFIRSYAGVPLSSPDGYNLGSLCAIDTVPRDFTPPQVEVMKSFAALVVDELELRRIAEIDSLTEVATRRSFLRSVEQELCKRKRHGGSAALLAVDIDHFKKVNDTYGHAAGDQVLRAVCAALASTLRTEDVVGRLGGEEFGILLCETDVERARVTAERARRAIESLVFEDTETFQVTASFGLVALDSDAAPKPDEWLARADAALYAAKRSGRNRVCIAGRETSPRREELPNRLRNQSTVANLASLSALCANPGFSGTRRSSLVLGAPRVNHRAAPIVAG